MLIRAHDLEIHNVNEIEQVKTQYGITGYQLAITKSYPLCERLITKNDIDQVEQVVFDNTKILGAYFNPVHPDQVEVKIGLENFITTMQLAAEQKIDYVATETGSCLGSPWNYHVDNHKQTTVNAVVEVFKEISQRTKELDVKIAIEPAYEHVIRDIEYLEEFTNAVADERIVYILDLFNLTKGHTYTDYREVLHRFLTYAQDKIKIVHLKDFKLNEHERVEQVKIGEGIVNFAYVIEAVQKYNKDALFVLEGTMEHDLKAAMNELAPNIKQL